MSGFFINIHDGRVATRGQLVEAALATKDEKPELPWHPIDGPRDASTMWYTVLHKKERGVFIGLLCIRHGHRLASLLERGWTEVPIEEIGVRVSGFRCQERCPDT